MKVYLKTTDNLGNVTRIWLIGRDDALNNKYSEVLSGSSRQFVRKMQIVTGALWASQEVRDRGNGGIIMDVAGTYEFDNEIAMWSFTNSLSRIDAQKPNLPTGDVYLRLELPGGTWIDERIPRAFVQITAVEPIGAVGLRLRYRITGPYTEANYEGSSGTYSWLLDNDGELLKDTNGFWIGDMNHQS